MRGLFLARQQWAQLCFHSEDEAHTPEQILVSMKFSVYPGNDPGLMQFPHFHLFYSFLLLSHAEVDCPALLYVRQVSEHVHVSYFGST